MENPRKIGFGDDSLFVMLQKYTKCKNLVYEIDIESITIDAREFWVITNFPNWQYVFVIYGEILELIKKEPLTMLEHTCVIVEIMVKEYSLRNEPDEKKQLQHKKFIRNVQNWITEKIIGRRDTELFKINQARIRQINGITPFKDPNIPNIEGIIPVISLPERFYEIIKEKMANQMLLWEINQKSN